MRSIGSSTIAIAAAVILTAVWLWRLRTKQWTAATIVVLFAASVFALAVLLLDRSMVDAALGTVTGSATGAGTVRREIPSRFGATMQTADKP